MYGAISQQVIGQQPQLRQQLGPQQLGAAPPPPSSPLDPLWQQSAADTAAYQQLAANAGAADRGLNQALFDQALRTGQVLRKDAFKQARRDKQYNIMAKALGGGAAVLGAQQGGAGGDVEPSWAEV